VQRELRRRSFREVENSFRRKMEQLQQNNVSVVWRDLKTISVHKKINSQPVGDQSFVNDLNSAHFQSGPELRRVPQLWKTLHGISAKVSATRGPQQLQPVAVTSHLKKTLKRLVVVHPCLWHWGMRSLSHLEKHCENHDFNSIQPTLLKLEHTGVDPHLTAWILDYLTNQPQYVRIWHCESDMVVCSKGALQGTVWVPFLFTLNSAEFAHNSAKGATGNTEN